MDFICATCGRRFTFSICMHEMVSTLACPRCHSFEVDPDLEAVFGELPPPPTITLIDRPSRRARAQSRLRVIEGAAGVAAGVSDDDSSPAGTLDESA